MLKGGVAMPKSLSLTPRLSGYTPRDLARSFGIPASL